MSGLLKKLVFSDDVLGVLSSMRWEDKGRLGFIDGTLDRSLYVKVNKALEAMGGKWSRKVGGHVFALDPRFCVEGLLDNGYIEVVRDGFFETPPAVIDVLFSILAPAAGLAYLEPSAGLGVIADAVANYTGEKDKITCVEINENRCGALRSKGYGKVICGDFMDVRPDDLPRFDRIYMNPPFELQQDIDHVLHALSFMKPSGALISVMSAGAKFNGNKKAVAFRDMLDSHPHAYLFDLPEGSFKDSGTMVNTVVLFVPGCDYFTRKDSGHA